MQQQQQLQTPKPRVSPKHQPNRLVLPSKTSPKPARPHISTCPPPTPNALRSSGKSNKWSAASESQYAGRQQSVRRSQSFAKNSSKPSLHVINEHERRVSDPSQFTNALGSSDTKLYRKPNPPDKSEPHSSSDTTLYRKTSKSTSSRSQEVELNPKSSHSPTTAPSKRSVSSPKKLQKTMDKILKLVRLSL